MNNLPKVVTQLLPRVGIQCSTRCATPPPRCYYSNIVLPRIVEMRRDSSISNHPVAMNSVLYTNSPSIYKTYVPNAQLTSTSRTHARRHSHEAAAVIRSHKPHHVPDDAKSHCQGAHRQHASLTVNSAGRNPNKCVPGPVQSNRHSRDYSHYTTSGSATHS